MQIQDQNTDFEVRSLDNEAKSYNDHDVRWHQFIKYGLAGMFFGIILVKSEAISWFRIQEMFRLQSFHMYGLIGSAVVVGLISVQLIRVFGVKTIQNEDVKVHHKRFSFGQVIGGLIFGLGWAMTGACPGPIYALIGSGATVFIVVLLSALAGTYVYGKFKGRLLH
jgi:uncharacterized membrane protein YedE/YeeE